MQIQIKILEEIDSEVNLYKEFILTKSIGDNIKVRIVDNDTSDDVEINVKKSDLIKALNVIVS